MPMPHRTQMQLIKRRLTGKEGAEKIRVLRMILSELPDYRNGPYADIRKWVAAEIEATRVRAHVVQRDSVEIRWEGAAQVALVGAPNAGKSSLLHALSHIQIRIENYAFTTLRPVPALTRIGGVLVQLVEIPGLIPGAAQDRGGGRALLGVLRGADATIYCHAVNAPLDSLTAVRTEVAAAGIGLPAMLAVTKMDEAAAEEFQRIQDAFSDLPVLGVSILDEASLLDLREAIWKLTGLIRIYLRQGAETNDEPLAMQPGVTVLDAARAIHQELAASCTGARLWGPSARFDGQRVGRDFPLQDGDIVEILIR